MAANSSTSTDLIPSTHALASRDSHKLPTLIASSDAASKTAWRDFFDGRLARNANTRRAYETAVRQFLSWAEEQALTLSSIRPGDVGIYLTDHPGSASTKKQHLAAIRRFFNLLVERHICIINPAATAETERLEVVEGKTPEITASEIKNLLEGFNEASLAGLRDKAAICIMMYTAARAGAVSRLRRGDYLGNPGAMKLRFVEKRGKHREIEVRADLEGILNRYLEVARMKTAHKECPFFRPLVRRESRFRPWVPKSRGVREKGRMTENDMCRMVKRRFEAAGVRSELSAHSFRVATITNLIEQGIPIEDVQNLAGHRDARTTKLYDRTSRKVTRNLVERISFS